MANHVVVPPLDESKSSDPRNMTTNLNWRDFIDSSWLVSISFHRLIVTLSLFYLMMIDDLRSEEFVSVTYTNTSCNCMHMISC